MIIINKIKTILKEGRNDPAIFKAIFIVGGPGSGKTYIEKKVARGLGLKSIDSDHPLTFLLKRDGYTTDLTKLDPTLIFKIRKHAKGLVKKIENIYINGKLGLIIMGTGWNVNSVFDMKEKLEEIGYETKMIFIHTSKEVALKRNKMRSRVIPEDIVMQKWDQTHANISNFKNKFGDDNVIMFNNDSAGGGEINKLHTKVLKFIAKPITNSNALKWLTNK